MLLIAGAALALASCSQDESTGINNGNAIDFRAAMETRATETTTANIAKFFVTAIDKNNANYFTDAEFAVNGTTFTSTPAYYWPADDSELSFFAYSPSATDLGATLSITKDAKTLTNYAPASTIANQQDFITTTATGKKSVNEGAGVALTFAHRLAQIEIKAKNGNTGYVYKVKGVRIGQPISKATFDFGTNAWTLGADKADYKVEYNTEKVLGATAVSIMETANDNAMLIPQQLTAWNSTTDKPNANKGAYLAVLVQIATASGARVYPTTVIAAGYDWVAVPINTKWEAGQKYIYTLDFSSGAGKVDPGKTPPTDPNDPFTPGGDILGSAIKFTVAVTPWTEATQPDVSM